MRLGADPEVFLMNTSNNKLISAIGKIGGSKHHPLHIKGMRKQFTLQEDNVALEFGIPPSKNREEFTKNIELVLKAGHKHVKGLAFSTLASASFPEEELEHPNAHKFGCEPDYNAYTGKENPRPDVDDYTFRTCGGHVHVELKKRTKEFSNDVVKAMDLFLGIPSLFMDKDTERRKLYGAAGACRYKEYGVEYRTLSNFWIFQPRLCEWVWDNTERAVYTAENLRMDRNLSERVQHTINNQDLDMAKNLIKEYELEVVS